MTDRLVKNKQGIAVAKNSKIWVKESKTVVRGSKKILGRQRKVIAVDSSKLTSRLEGVVANRSRIPHKSKSVIARCVERFIGISD